MQMIALLTEASKLTEEERHLAVNLETVKWELTDAEKELKWLKSAASSSEKEHEQILQDIEDAKIELDNERCFSFWVHLLRLLVKLITLLTKWIVALQKLQENP